ncbi:cation transporter [Candidatus Woesearchaeota archaeon]|nr:cation transporter [Candidatus Woesearchaeota archaeon]
MNSQVHKKILWLSYFTVGYNILEGILSIIVGLFSGSIALQGFGLDSFVESFSGVIMIWRFGKHKEISKEKEMLIEKKALRLVAYAFFLLSFYIFYESVRKLYLHEAPDPNLLGIIIAIVSLIIMPILFFMKYRIGNAIKSKSLIADSKQTLICMSLSVAVLMGLGLNYLYGFWQADPIAGLIIVMFIIREGYLTLKEEKLCAC